MPDVYHNLPQPIPKVTPEIVTRFWCKVKKTDNCWEWGGAILRNGYGRFWMGGKDVKAHRASYVIANGPIPIGEMVLHKCDNPKCVRPEHLFSGTGSDNMRDMVNKGRSRRPDKTARGERVAGARLTEFKVIQARSEFDHHGGKFFKLAEKYGVSRAAMHAIVHRINWRHIP